jgi:hypothetical protein
VRRSDNDAATAIHARVGVAGLAALGRRVGMRRFAPYPVWGGSSITADDQARFFLRVDWLVPRRHRRYAMSLLRGVVPEQRWGLAAAVPDGWRIAFKGGWGKGVTQQVDHQAALLTNGRMRVSIAVLTADNPSDGYGAATQEGVARRLLRGLDRRLIGTVRRVRRGLQRSRQRWASNRRSASASRRCASGSVRAMPQGQACGTGPLYPSSAPIASRTTMTA